MIMNGLKSESEKKFFCKFCKENRLKLFVVALKVLHDEAAAEDAVLSCFTNLAKAFEQYSHLSPKELSQMCCSVVWCIAHNMAMAHSLQNVKSNATDSSLTEEEKQLLILKYVLELKNKQIGELLGISEFVIYKKISTSQKKLPQYTEDIEYAKH